MDALLERDERRAIRITSRALEAAFELGSKFIAASTAYLFENSLESDESRGRVRQALASGHGDDLRGAESSTFLEIKRLNQSSIRVTTAEGFRYEPDDLSALLKYFERRKEKISRIVLTFGAAYSQQMELTFRSELTPLTISIRGDEDTVREFDALIKDELSPFHRWWFSLPPGPSALVFVLSMLCSAAFWLFVVLQFHKVGSGPTSIGEVGLVIGVPVAMTAVSMIAVYTVGGRIFPLIEIDIGLHQADTARRRRLRWGLATAPILVVAIPFIINLLAARMSR
jgi:hypothetical protein